MNKTVYTKIVLKQLGKTVNDATVAQYMPVWWQNTRQKDTGGLRLTEDGLDAFIQAEIATYDIPYPMDMPLTTQVIIFLDQFIDCPYYLNHRSIVVTNEKKAVELALFSGDLRKYGLTKAMNRQLEDED